MPTTLKHSPSPAAPTVEVLRCECGRLLARVLKSAVELKCARCKRIVILIGGRRFAEAGAAGCECLESLCGKGA